MAKVRGSRAGVQPVAPVEPTEPVEPADEFDQPDEGEDLEVETDVDTTEVETEEAVTPAPVVAPAATNPFDKPVAFHQYKDGRLTRDSMESIIRAGGSVAHKGSIYTNIADLPSDDVLNATTPVLDQTASIDAQIAALQAQKAALVK